MHKFFTLSLCFFSLSTMAQVRPELFEDESKYQKLSLDEIQEQKEFTLKDEAIITDRNAVTGIKDKQHYTGADYNRFAGSYQFNPKLVKLADFSAFEVSYARKAWGLWWQAFLSRTQSTFEVIGENKDINAGGTESSFQRPDSSRETIISYGFGTGYRFRSIFEWIKFDDIFETISVFGTRHSLSESYRDLTYNGWGFRADYAVHKRSSSLFFYGGKVSYNIAKVKRTLEPLESSSQAALALSWVSVGFELGTYF